MPARRYTVAVIGLGVLGVALVGVFLWMMTGRTRDEMERDHIDVSVRHGAWFQAELERAYRSIEAREGSAAGGFGNLLWPQAAAAVEESWSAHPEFAGARLRGSNFERVIGGGPEIRDWSFVKPDPARVTAMRAEGDAITASFVCPARAGPSSRVEVNVLLRPRTLEHENTLVWLVMTSAAALCGILYLLGAVVLFVDRAHARLMSREREKATRLRAMGEVAGGIAHEVRNPLNAISLSVQYLERLFEKGGRAPTAGDYARIHLELGKIRKVVDNFVRFARIRDMVVAPMDLGEAVDAVVARLARELAEASIEVEVVRDGDTSCTGDREKLEEVIEAVVRNAIDSMHGKADGELRIRLAGSRRGIRTTIRDTGDVIDDTAVRNIFVPYFTRRDHAIGLGMTMARTLVESHGGTIDASPAQGGGCVVTIALPRKVL